MFTKSQLKAMLGFSVNTRSNDYIIDGILMVLQKLDLIKVEIRNVLDEASNEVKKVKLK